jgi:acid phosphatase family membrane protein YuiD
MAVVFASIVMYDASGVRLQAGIHAEQLNAILPLIGKQAALRGEGKFVIIPEW